jgi:hypothetical protein
MELLTFWLTIAGGVCWAVCFWWMHRISKRQDSVLCELREQAKRIERLSKAEHDLIKEVHPKVDEIQEGMTKVVETVRHGQS